jgi:hypothetical protein
MMHGGTTSIFGLMSVNRAEFGEAQRFRTFAPGLALAVLIHGLFNQGFLPPVISAAAVLVLPIMLSLIFWRSEERSSSGSERKLDKDMTC